MKVAASVKVAATKAETVEYGGMPVAQGGVDALMAQLLAAAAVEMAQDPTDLN